MIRLIRQQGAGNSIALLLLRVVVGLAFIFHGSTKIPDPEHWARMVLPVAPGWLQATAAWAEFGGGILLIAGFLTPLAAFLIACDMTTAIFFVHIPHGAHFVGGRGPFELPLLYLVIMIGFLLTGPGTYSLDALIFGRRRAAPTRSTDVPV